MADTAIGSKQCAAHDAKAYAVMAAFQAATYFNTADLTLQVFLKFQRRTGIYFWSLTVASTGCALVALAFTLKNFASSTPWWIPSLINMFGWWAMVTGHSLVLWSRLHLVLLRDKDKFILRAVLAMIIIDAICLHIPTSVLTWLSLSPHPPDEWRTAYSRIEKTQLCIFVVQETIISLLYVKATLKLLTPTCQGKMRSTFLKLISVNVVIIIMDMMVLGMEFADHWDIQANLKPFVYSVKLKLEFVILNQLVKYAKPAALGGLNDGATTPNEQKESTLPMPRPSTLRHRTTGLQALPATKANTASGWPLPDSDRQQPARRDFEPSRPTRTGSMNLQSHILKVSDVIQKVTNNERPRRQI